MVDRPVDHINKKSKRLGLYILVTSTKNVHTSDLTIFNFFIKLKNLSIAG